VFRLSFLVFLLLCDLVVGILINQKSVFHRLQYFSSITDNRDANGGISAPIFRKAEVGTDLDKWAKDNEVELCERLKAEVLELETERVKALQSQLRQQQPAPRKIGESNEDIVEDGEEEAKKDTATKDTSKPSVTSYEDVKKSYQQQRNEDLGMTDAMGSEDLNRMDQGAKLELGSGSLKTDLKTDLNSRLRSQGFRELAPPMSPVAAVPEPPSRAIHGPTSLPEPDESLSTASTRQPITEAAASHNPTARTDSSISEPAVAATVTKDHGFLAKRRATDVFSDAGVFLCVGLSAVLVGLLLALWRRRARVTMQALAARLPK
jgi:hypothetical protein